MSQSGGDSASDCGQSRLLLLDIEGTTSSVSFVYDVMFPYARRELRGFLQRAEGSQELLEALKWMARDAGHPDVSAWLGDDQSLDASGRKDRLERIEAEALRRMDGDSKSTGLKQLQGLIWRDGFRQGELRAHVYEDVPACLRRRRAQGLDTRIYSSGSVEAQRLFFAHTIAGDLTDCLHGHYDTTSGPKQATASYRSIADACQRASAEILFVSDVVAELNAAREAGMATALAVRPGNRSIEDPEGHPVIHSFEELPGIE